MNSKALIAVVNARTRQNTWAAAVRSTWFDLVPKELADVKFIVGRGEGEVPLDTLTLDCDDSYQGLPSKVQAIARYAASQGYHHVLKLDDDVIIKPNALLSSGYDKYQYSGRANRRPNAENPFWVPMGFAYWMNSVCMDIISKATLPNNNDDERWVAESLHRHGIELHDDKRYHLYMGGLLERPPRVNRPLRIGVASQNLETINNGFAWCTFMEVGGVPQRIPVEEKIKEFHKIHQKFGETRLLVTPA